MIRFPVFLLSVFAALLIPLEAKAPRKYSAAELINIAKRSYACGRAQGMIDAFRATGRQDAEDATKAVWIEAKCDLVMELYEVQK